LYVSNSASGEVTAYTYLNGNGLLLVGDLTGAPETPCASTTFRTARSSPNSQLIFHYPSARSLAKVI